MKRARVRVTAGDWYVWFLVPDDRRYGEAVELPPRLVTRWRKAYAEYAKVQKLLDKHLGRK